MLTKGQRALLVVFYLYVAWAFFTATGSAVITVLWYSMALDPAGAVVIPIAGFFAGVGWFALRSVVRTLHTPYL